MTQKRPKPPQPSLTPPEIPERQTAREQAAAALYADWDAMYGREVRPQEDSLPRASITVVYPGGVTQQYAGLSDLPAPPEGYEYHWVSGVGPDALHPTVVLKRKGESK